MKSRREQSRHYWAVELRFYMLTRLLSKDALWNFRVMLRLRMQRDSGLQFRREGVLGAGPVWHRHETMA